MKANNNESPLEFSFGGNMAAMIQAARNRAPGQSQTAAMLGGSLSGQAKELFEASQTAQNPEMTNVPPAQANTLGQAQPAASAMSGNEIQGEGGLESRIAALEQGTESNDLGNFKPQDVLAAGTRFGQQQVPGTFDRSLNAQNLT